MLNADENKLERCPIKRCVHIYFGFPWTDEQVGAAGSSSGG